MNEELMKLRAELAAWHEQFGTSQLSHAIAERDGLKKHNAQLAAALVRAAQIPQDYADQGDWDKELALSIKTDIQSIDPPSALRALLLPTIDLLQLAISRGCWPHEKCVHNELVRLRELCGEKG